MTKQQLQSHISAVLFDYGGVLDEAGGTPTIAELDSNSHPSTGINTMSKAFDHTFNFVNRYYYVEIKINRKNTGSPWIGGMKLCEQFQ